MQAYDTTEWEELQQKHGNLEGHQTGRDRLRVCASAPLLVSLCSFSFSFCLPHLYLSLTHTHARTRARARTHTHMRCGRQGAAGRVGPPLPVPGDAGARGRRRRGGDRVGREGGQRRSACVCQLGEVPIQYPLVLPLRSRNVPIATSVAHRRTVANGTARPRRGQVLRPRTRHVGHSDRVRRSAAPRCTPTDSAAACVALRCDVAASMSPAPTCAAHSHSHSLAS